MSKHWQELPDREGIWVALGPDGSLAAMRAEMRTNGVGDDVLCVDITSGRGEVRIPTPVGRLAANLKFCFLDEGGVE